MCDMDLHNNWKSFLAIGHDQKHLDWIFPLLLIYVFVACRLYPSKLHPGSNLKIWSITKPYSCVLMKWQQESVALHVSITTSTGLGSSPREACVSHTWNHQDWKLQPKHWSSVCETDNRRNDWAWIICFKGLKVTIMRTTLEHGRILKLHHFFHGYLSTSLLLCLNTAYLKLWTFVHWRMLS